MVAAQEVLRTVLAATAVIALVQAARLSVLPGAARRRSRLLYRFANWGSPPQNLPELPDVARLSVRVVRILGQNRGSFTLQGTNTYVVGTGTHRAIVDAGDGNSKHIVKLKEFLANEGATISDVVVTHWHEDHMGGVPLFRREFPGVRVWKKLLKDDERDPTGGSFDKRIENGTVIAVEGATLRALLTPGHTKDHIALVFEEEGAIFTGDCVLGSGTAVFESLHEYMGSLRILRRELELLGLQLEQQVPKLYPGHGPVVQDGCQKVRDYIAHRQLREDQVLKFLHDNKGPQALETMVDFIYADQHLNFVLKRGARQSIKQHLEKLKRDGKITEKGSRWALR